MNAVSVVLALDLGTSSCKDALYSAGGDRLALTASGYETSVPGPGFAEQSPEQYLAASQSVCTELAERARSLHVEISAVSFGTQTPTLVICDCSLMPVGPAIIWQDSRAT